MKYNWLAVVAVLLISACDSDDNPAPAPDIDVPATYSFVRSGASTVSFSGQTTRIRMGEELISAMKDFSSTEEALLEMYRNKTASDGDANPFEDAELNASTKSIKSKTGASKDLFSANATEAAEIKADFESWISAQVSEVFPNEEVLAEAGVAGQIDDGGSTRYVNAKGLEYNQAVNKSLIGGLMLDQLINNYLGETVLDESTNREDNDNETLADGKNYTTMEHKWDEAYGYLFGNADNTAAPMSELGSSDSFLNKYLGRVAGDEDFANIGQEIYDALKLGRAAIVAKQYDVRDEQAAILRQKLSEVIAIRTIYYLQQGKNALADGKFGTAFHDLSEGFGFVYSLRFTRNPNTPNSFFSKSEVDGFINDIYGSDNGFWDLDGATLDAVSESIASKFDFTVEQAGS
jgi:hypothetical protein